MLMARNARHGLAERSYSASRYELMVSIEFGLSLKLISLPLKQRWLANTCNISTLESVHCSSSFNLLPRFSFFILIAHNA